MYIQQLYTGCLAEAAYYIESGGEAAIVDPIREIEPYLKLAAERGTTIKYVLETHFHADFVSGHVDLAAATGARIVFGPGAIAEFEIYNAAHGERLKLGSVEIEALHTPGHTPESTCWLLHDESGKPVSVFTGDTLFVGDVGRPDLLDGVIISKEEQVSHLYDSLNNVIKRLPDDVIVYPGHGPGSMCGKSIGKETESTIGKEKKTNYALQDMTREEFARIVLADQPAAPQYFVKNAIINRKGYDPLHVVMERNSKSLSVAELEAEVAAGALLLDARNGDEFTAAYIPGSLNVGLDGSFAVWVGTLADIKRRMVVIAPEGRESETILRLARVGYENVAGYLEGGVNAWKTAGKPVASVDNVDAPTFAGVVKDNKATVLDVRNPGEWNTAHVVGAQHIPLRDLAKRLDELNPSKEYYIHCAGGYRSVIASSMLQAAGFDKLHNVAGGFANIKDSVPVVSEAAVPA